ncbi:serine/threonine protein kinase [Archangium gephyra]|nr:serine/threonine protein kinase [Archangium gephyra]
MKAGSNWRRSRKLPHSEAPWSVLTSAVQRGFRLKICDSPTVMSFTPSPARDESLPLQCPLCESALAEGRCERCGAAARPGGFLVRRLLSCSAHGRLYVAEAPDGTLVALKELVFSLVPEARQLEAFEREARLLREVSHPHIPRFVASFQEGHGVGLRLYLAQELVQGTSLRELLRERRLREEEALEVARQVLDVLCYLHELSPRIVHRDVKPANLVRREDGKTFLVDFGAARDLFGSGTAGATMVGTFGYMPPEQLGGTLHATCDLYALGASLLHLLSGKHPEELLAPDLSLDVEAHAALSPRMTRFLRKLVARDPAKRFRSARDARLALESSSGDNRLRWRHVAAAGLVLAAVTGGTMQGWHWLSAAPAPVQKAPPPEWRPEPPLLPEFPPHARWRFDEHSSQLPWGEMTSSASTSPSHRAC